MFYLPPKLGIISLIEFYPLLTSIELGNGAANIYKIKTNPNINTISINFDILRYLKLIKTVKLYIYNHFKK